MPKLPSKVWQYFSFIPDNPKVTICQVPITNQLTNINAKCNKSMSYNSSSTSAMARHLKTQHNIIVNESKTSVLSTSNQPNEQHLIKQSINSASETLARCAVDGMSIDTILNSDILKDYLDKVHHSQMPKTEKEFNEIIIEYYNQVVEKYKLLFQDFKSKNGTFSVSLNHVWITFQRNEVTELWTVLTVNCSVDSKVVSFALTYTRYIGELQVQEVLIKFGLDLDLDIVGCKQKSQLLDIIKPYFQKYGISNQLLFLTSYFLNKAELANNEQTIKHNTVTKLSSQVWHYFAFKPDNPKVTICQITSSNVKCNKSMSYSSSSTSAMARHLKSQHNIDIHLLNNKRKSKLRTVKQASSQFATEESNKSLGEILSRCELEGMSISTITNSLVIKDYIDKVHHLKMSNSEEEIVELIVKFYEKAVDQYRKVFEHFKTKEATFSVTLNFVNHDCDELSVHCNVDSKIETFYLAKTCLHDELDKTLRIYGLDLDSDIVACTWDNDYKEYKELSSGVIKQFCLIRSIDRVLNLSKYYIDIYRWANTLNNFFQSFKHNSNVLQKYVIAGGGQMIEFIEYGYNWILVVQIAEWLLKLQLNIKDAFESGQFVFSKHHTNSEVYYNEAIFSEFKHFVEMMKPLQEAVTELDKPNASLLTAEIVMKYVFMKLKQFDWDICFELVDKLKVKYKEIRNQNVVSLMYFLKHRKYPTDDFEGFQYSCKDEIIKTANYLNQKFFPKRNHFTHTINHEISHHKSRNSTKSSTLRDFINEEMRETKDAFSNVDLSSHFELAEKTKTLTSQLAKLYNALLTIRPSVVNLETNINYLLSYDKIENQKKELNNKLIFLKQYFIRKDAKQVNQPQKRLLESNTNNFAVVQ